MGTVIIEGVFWAWLQNMAAVKTIATTPYHGYSVVFSPFIHGKLAMVGALNYGIAGAGSLMVFEFSEQGYKELNR